RQGISPIARPLDLDQKVRAKLLLVVVACCLFSLTAFSQKGSFAEITQLQGPQKPRVGFIVQAVPKADPKTGEAKLRQVIGTAYASLRRGTSAAVAAKTALRTITSSKLFTADVGVVVLDKKEKLAAIGSGNFTGKTCSAAAIGSAGAARSACEDVEHHAVTVQAAAEGIKGGGDTSVVVMDKFANMAFTRTSTTLIGYLGSDGKAVVK
ncbi:MAG TPA: hypothetical protein VL501_09430, partial [Pyrinomonadaceae bacterium]|nr:hypothetical protein [Pyrinomonadaceae bacterium]